MKVTSAEKAWKKAREIGKRRLPGVSASKWLDETRGPVELPQVKRKL